MSAFSSKRSSEPQEPEAISDSVCQTLVQCAQPFLRRGNNPFFALEIRLLERYRKPRGSSGIEDWFLFAYCMMGVFALFPFLEKFLDKGPPSPQTPELATSIVALGSLLMCLVAALWGAGRIFQREHFCGTLLDTFLLPIEPLQWLRQKSALAFFALCLAWLSALPFHAVLLFAGEVRFVILLKALLLPLWAGLVAIGYTLLTAPDYLCDPPRPQPQGEPSRSPSQEISLPRHAADWGRSLMALAFGIISFFGWMAWIFGDASDFNPLWQMLPFYGMFAPPLFLGLMVNGAFFVAAFAHAAAMLSPSFEARRRSAAVCWSALATIYYTALGFFWWQLDSVVAVAALFAAPVAALLVSWLTSQEKVASQGHEEPSEAVQNEVSSAVDEAPLARKTRKKILENEGEIAWLTRRFGGFDNAVFVKDLRIHLRRESLRNSLLINLLLAPVVFWLLQKAAPGGGIYWAFLFSVFNNSAAQKASEAWRQETRGVTLTLLLISPLSSRQIIGGRFRAALIAGSANLLFCFAILGALGWNLGRGGVTILPAVIAALPLPFLSLSYDAAAAPGDDLENTKKGDTVGGGGCMAMLWAIPCVALLFWGRNLPLWLMWSISGGLFLFFTAYACAVFDAGVKKLDKLRGLASS